MADVREKKSGALLKLAVLVALVTTAILVANLTPLDRYLSREGVGRAIEWLRASESAPLLYIAIYAAATALAIPGSILTLAGGAMFGLLWGTVYTTVAANIGANAAFGVARSLGRDGIRALAGDRLDALDRATRDYGFRGLLTLRLIPVVPFNALNFGAGLTAIGWPAYAAATAIGIFPGTVVYTMFADALLEGSQEASRDALVRVLVSGALLVLLSFLPTIARRLGIRIPGSGGEGGPDFGADDVAAGGDTEDADERSGSEAEGREGPSGAPGTSTGVAVLVASAVALSHGALAAQPAASGASGGPGPSGAPEQAVAPGQAATPGSAAFHGSLPSHEPLTAILSEVVEQPDVDYAELVERRDALDGYLATLGAVDVESLEAAPRDARLAFWINAYNACMLRLVADHYPIVPDGGVFSAIRNTLSGRPENSVWQIEDVFTREHCHVAGDDRSQDEIEHEIIRPGFDEPRIHFAVNCAARSCPVLWPEAYTADRLDEQLDRAVRELVGTPWHFEVEGSTVRMNKVLDWYKEDFGGIEGLRAFFAPYLPEEDAAVLIDPDTDIEFFEYDWTLNDAES